MSKYWSEVVRQLEPYIPGEQPQIEGLIKLNTNESPYPPSPQVAAVLDAENTERLRLYPDPNAQMLKASLAQYYGVKTAQVFVGNGSDDVLAQTFMAFFQQLNPVLFPDITYSFYTVYCQLFGIAAKRLPLGEDLSLNLTDYQRPNGGIIFPNPNAPTGIGLPLCDIKVLLESNTESVVVVDEAYIDFGGESAIALVPEFDNLLVIQTLSKSRALAGMRVGYAIGHERLIEGLERVKNSYNSYPLDRLAQITAVASIEDDDYFKASCKKVITTREKVAQELTDLGCEVLPSQTNFLFVKPPPSITAKLLSETLRAHKILVRFFNKPRINQYLRISIGTDEQMKTLLNALLKILKA